MDNAGEQLLTKWGADNTGVGNNGNVYEYNCFGVEAYGFISWDGTAHATYNAFERAYGARSNSVEADPTFTNAPNADFTLRAGSPCYGAGISNANVIASLGNVPFGTKPDVGACSHLSGVDIDFSEFFIGEKYGSIARIDIWLAPKTLYELEDATK